MPDAAMNKNLDVPAYGSVEIDETESLVAHTEIPHVHVPGAPSGRSPVRLLAYSVFALGFVALGASYGKQESSSMYAKDHAEEFDAADGGGDPAHPAHPPAAVLGEHDSTSSEHGPSGGGGHSASVSKGKVKSPNNGFVWATSDKNAGDETRGLYDALQKISNEPRFLFGHQNDNYLGQYFMDKDGSKHNSDVFNGTGSYPAVFGFDFTDIIVKERNFTEHVKFAYSQGAVIEFDWLASNPATADTCDGWTGSCEKDVTKNGCEGIAKGSGDTWDQWASWLDQIADTIKTFKHDDGTDIPVIFRFLHETSGRWYWWGDGSNSTGGKVCPDEQYIDVWNNTHHYMHNYHNLHNLLWLYAPSDPKSKYKASFEQRYPGDHVVDLVGFDQYDSVGWYNETILASCEVVANFTTAHGKVPVIAESGILDGIQDVWDDEWFYRDYAEKLMKDQYCSKLAYALSWENAHPDQYWVPLPSDRTYEGFAKMHESDYSIFADDKKWQKYAAEYGYNTNL